MRFYLSILLCIYALSAVGQDADSSKVKSSWYARSMFLSTYAGPGRSRDRITQNFEVGRSIGPVDVGLAYGRTSRNPDSTHYLQARITMDACQYGIFSNEFSIGGGYVFNSQKPIILELSSTIFAQIGKYWGLGVVTGYYDISGPIRGGSKNFYGIFLRVGLLRNDRGILVNRGRMSHHMHHGR